MPDIASGNGLPHSDEKCPVVETRIDQTVVLAQQLCARIPTDLAQLVVGIDDVSVDIRGTDNRMLVQRKLLVRQVGQGRLQVSLAFLFLTHQRAHQLGEILQVVVEQAGLVQIHKFHQSHRCGTQGFHGPGAAPQFRAQTRVALRQLHRTQFQTACLELQVPVVLDIRLIDPLQ